MTLLVDIRAGSMKPSDCARPQSQAVKLTVGSVFWLSISRRGLDFDDIAAEGIFMVADPKLCFYSYWRASQL